MRALARFVVADGTIGDTLQRVAELTLEAIPAAEVAGITLLQENGRPTTAVYTDERSPNIDSGQYRDDAGPCLEAFRRGEIVRVDDVDDVVDRWPSFAKEAAAVGVRSTCSFPLLAGSRTLGALNLYSTRDHAFAEEHDEAGMELASAMSIVLANASAYWSAQEENEHLQEAMRSRATIEQAKGILMAQSGLTADQAFDMLRRASQRENVKLRDIATRIVANTSGSADQEPNDTDIAAAD